MDIIQLEPRSNHAHDAAYTSSITRWMGSYITFQIFFYLQTDVHKDNKLRNIFLPVEYKFPTPTTKPQTSYEMIPNIEWCKRQQTLYSLISAYPSGSHFYRALCQLCLSQQRMNIIFWEPHALNTTYVRPCP